MSVLPRRLVVAALLAAGALVTSAGPLAAQHEGHAPVRPAGGRDTVAVRLAASARLGDLAFPNSGAPAAQDAFLRGVALLHNFEYDAAGEAFRTAQRADPAFALPYWLEAFSYSHIVWGTEELARSRAVLARLGATPAARLAKAPTPRERAYGAAVEALYADGVLGARTRAFADSMRGLAAAHRDDHEAQVFAAIAMMSAAVAGSPPPNAAYDSLMRDAAALAERVFAANPRHPGAAHFVIHTNDDPVHAAHALPAARTYAQIAPASDHAQHMPSHIFVQLGHWEEAAASNERAWAATRAEVAERRHPTARLSWHVLSWLEYAYLQQGRLRDARALIDSARPLLAEIPPGDVYSDARVAIPLMEFLYASSTGRWDAWTGAVPARMPGAGLQPREVSSTIGNVYWTALAAAHRGDVALADSLARLLRARAAANARPPSVGVLQVEALSLARRGHLDSAITALAALEVRHDSTPPIGPPSIVPTSELLGDLLLAANRPADAAAAYERTLRTCPNRAAPLLGLARARSKAGDRAGAARAYRELTTLWKTADADLPELEEARKGARIGG